MADSDSRYYLGHDPVPSMRDAIKTAEHKAKRHFEKMERAKQNEEYGVAALKGGANVPFESESDIKNYYGTEWRNQQSSVISIRDELATKLNEILATYLKLDVEEVAEAQTALSVIESDEMLQRYLADPAHRHYSHYLAVSRYAQDHKDLKVAQAVATRFRQFESACANVIKRTQGVLINERYYDGAWLSWIEYRLNDVEEAIEAMEKAANGERVDAWTALSAGVM